MTFGRAWRGSLARHGQHSVEGGDRYAFTRRVNATPLLAVEFVQAAKPAPPPMPLALAT